MGTLRKMAGEFRSQFDEAMREADLADVQKEVQELKKLNPLPSVRKSVADAVAPIKDLPKAIEEARPAADPKAAAPLAIAPAAATEAPANDTAAPAPASDAQGVASPGRRSVAERAAEAWRKAVGDEAGG
jgi:sec-independent protein translocase protein TatB